MVEGITSTDDAERGGRLIKAMARSNCSVAALALACCKSERQVSRWRKGYPISDNDLDVVARVCEVSKEYLLTGELPPPLTYMTDKNTTSPDGVNVTGDTGTGHEEQLAINHVPINRYHVALLRHIRALPELEAIAAVDHIINTRHAMNPEPFKGGSPILDGVPLSDFEIAMILTLRSIPNHGSHIGLINRILGTRSTS